MAGFCKRIKAGMKAIKKDLTRDVLVMGVEVMGGFAPLIAEGRVSKATAGDVVSHVLVTAKGIALKSAQAAVSILASAMEEEINNPETPTKTQAEAAPIIREEMIDADDNIEEVVEKYLEE